MNKQSLNKNYYQTNKELIKARQKERYQSRKQEKSNNKKSNLGEYYHANNIRVLISLKDYLDSSPERMKLWYRFSAVLNDIKEGISDIIEVMRLREVMNDLITDYWTTAKKQIKITKRWNKLSEKQKLAKQKQWATELKREEQELFAQFEQQQANQQKKQIVKEISDYKSNDLGDNNNRERTNNNEFLPDKDREKKRDEKQQQLQQVITNKPNKTAEEEQDLKDKKEELEKLNKANSEQDANKNNWLTPTLLIGGIVIIGLVIYLVSRNKKSKY